MKQHITSDQLNEYLELKIENQVVNLNFERQEKLNKLLGTESKRGYPPNHLITIGKMIEILSEKQQSNIDLCIMLSKEYDKKQTHKNKWKICDLHWNDINSITESHDELVDALWDAVTLIL